MIRRGFWGGRSARGWRERGHIATQIVVLACILPTAGLSAPGDLETPEAGDPAAASEPFVEEITVTAQKREQSLHEVPISIALLDGEILELENRNQFTELQYLTPGLTFSAANTPRGEGSILRGVGTISFSDGLEGSVGIVVDGVVLGRQGMGLQDLADVERVEVLRGPQGTLFGKNASAGVISIVTRPPARRLAGSFRLSYGSLEEVKLSGSVGGSLGRDRLATRLSLYSNRRDGIVEDVARGLDYNGRNESGVRGKLLIDAGPRVSILLASDYAKRDDPCCIWTTRATTPDGFIRAGQAPVVASPENHQVSLSGRVLAEQSFGGGSVELNAVLGSQTLTSLTAFRRWDEFDTNDGDQTTIDVMDLNSGEQAQRQLSQELRAAGIRGDLDWVAGLFYFGEEVESTETWAGTFLVPLPPGARLGTQTVRAIRTVNYALFGDVTWSMTDRLQLFGGLRGIREEKRMRFVRGDLPGHLSMSPGGFGPIELESRIDDVDVTGRFGLRYTLDPRSNVYAKVVRGYKGGGFNTLTPINSVEVLRPEIPSGFELGLWNRNRRYRLSATLFVTRVEDFQAQSYEVLSGGFVHTNAGKLETRGLEMALDYQPTPRLSLSANTTYMDATFREFPGAPCYFGQPAEEGCDPTAGTQDLRGVSLPNAPDWTLSLAGHSSFDLGQAPFDGFVRGSYYWRDAVLFSLDRDPGSRQASYGIVNLGLGILSEEGRYQARLFAKNLFDQQFVGLIFSLPFDPGGYAQFPTIDARRTIGIALDITY